MLQGLPSSHVLSSVQQPAIGLRPQTPTVHVPGLQVDPGQSAAVQHCSQLPPQSFVLTGHTQTPPWQVFPSPQSVPSPTAVFTQPWLGSQLAEWQASLAWQTSGAWLHVVVASSHVSTLHTLPSSHWPSLVQQPAIGVRTHCPLLHATGLHAVPPVQVPHSITPPQPSDAVP
jgi:hypothetical protein